MPVVFIKLDESIVNVCLVHQPCPRIGKLPSVDCDRRWIYGVAGVVYESEQDLEDLRQRLSIVSKGILARTGIEDAPRMTGYRAHGWHATKDGPEFAEPLLVELDRGSTFKGHVRYVISKDAFDPKQKDHVFDRLFINLLRVLMRRYRSWDSIDVVFEADQSPPTRYDRIIRQSRPLTGVTVSAEEKGDSGLAMADYLLYATLKFIARVMERCQALDCDVSHSPPNANAVTYNIDGIVELESHLTGSDHALRMYKAFVRSVSSVIEVPGIVDGLSRRE